MTEKEILGVVSLCITLCSSAVYIHGIWRRGIRPHAFTWLIWTVVAAITFAAQFSEGAGPGAWWAGLVVLTSAGYMMVGFMQKEKDITKGDAVVLAIALCAIPAWQVTDNALWAILIVSGVDILATWPTLRKTWHAPRGESMAAFLLWTVPPLFSITALEVYNPTTVLYPLVVTAVNAVVASVIFFRRRAVP